MLNIKEKHLKCPICGGLMQRCEDNAENWGCDFCKIVVFIKMIENKGEEQ